MFNDLLERLFPWKNTINSRDEVKRRLKLVIAHDRAGLNSQVLDRMKQEILEVVSRYVELDSEELEFSIENSDRATALIANLPIQRVKMTELRSHAQEDVTSQSDSNVNGDDNSDSNTNSDTDINLDRDANSDADTDSDIDANSDAELELNLESEPELGKL